MNGSAIRTVLKYGGLAFSGILTISLFVRLFGTGAYGLSMAIAALALFEIGASGWSTIWEDAREGQRTIATVCLAITVALSLLSSLVEIVLATNLGADTLAIVDMEFITLVAIAAALATNVVGAITFQFNDPDVHARSSELARQARVKTAQDKHRNKLTELSLTKAEERIEGMANEIASQISEGTAQQVITQLLASSPRQLPPPRPQLPMNHQYAQQVEEVKLPSFNRPPFSPPVPPPPPTPNSTLNKSEVGVDPNDPLAGEEEGDD